MKTIEAELSFLKENKLLRILQVSKGIDFSSNDYLGLARSEKVRLELIAFLQNQKYLGATGSRLISGENDLTKETEDMLARTFRSDSCLIFGSGYLANIGVIEALGGTHAEFFSDVLNHASIIDGIKLSKTRVQIYQHNNLTHLEDLLKASSATRKIVVTESVFSMDGDSPNLQELCKICERFGAFLIVDEAHATGVCGSNRLGLMEDVLYDRERTVIIHTCGKALGAYGAFITCSQEIRTLIINKARSFIYSTAPSFVMVAQIGFAVQQVLANCDLARQLLNNVELVKKLFSENSLTWSGSHIGYVLIPGNECVLAVATELQDLGINLKAIRSPTVPAGKERLRITLKSFHQEADLKMLSHSLRQVLE